MDAMTEIVLEPCEGCGTYCADLNGDRVCPPCIAAGLAPEPFWRPYVGPPPSADYVLGECLIEEQSGEPCGEKCPHCDREMKAGHPVAWVGSIGDGYCSFACLEMSR